MSAAAPAQKDPAGAFEDRAAAAEATTFSSPASVVGGFPDATGPSAPAASVTAGPGPISWGLAAIVGDSSDADALTSGFLDDSGGGVGNNSMGTIDVLAAALAPKILLSLLLVPLAGVGGGILNPRSTAFFLDTSAVVVSAVTTFALPPALLVLGGRGRGRGFREGGGRGWFRLNLLDLSITGRDDKVGVLLALARLLRLPAGEGGGPTKTVVGLGDGI